MKTLAAILALAATASAAPRSTLWTDAIPPARFQGATMVPVLFMPPADVLKFCGGKPPAGMVVVACTELRKDGTKLVVLPTPCPSAHREYYARIACHELAHVRGWPATHGE